MLGITAARTWRVIAWLPALITVVYGVGTYYSAWDYLSGRRALQAAYDRLRSPSGYPTTFVFADEPEFPALLEWARDHAAGPDFRANLRQGLLPTCFSRAGGGEVSAPMPGGDPPFVFVPESSPVLAAYNYTRERRDNAKACWCGSLADLSGVITRSREDERFRVTTLLLGVLSLLLAWHTTAK